MDHPQMYQIRYQQKADCMTKNLNAHKITFWKNAIFFMAQSIPPGHLLATPSLCLGENT